MEIILTDQSRKEFPTKQEIPLHSNFAYRSQGSIEWTEKLDNNWSIPCKYVAISVAVLPKAGTSIILYQEN